MRRRREFWFRCGELHASFALFIQTNQPALLPVTVDVLLRGHRTQPSFERTAASVGSKLRNAFSLSRAGAVTIGVNGICQLACRRAFFGNVSCNVVMLFAITPHEDFRGTPMTCCAHPGRR